MCRSFHNTHFKTHFNFNYVAYNSKCLRVGKIQYYPKCPETCPALLLPGTLSQPSRFKVNADVSVAFPHAIRQSYTLSPFPHPSESTTLNLSL